MPCRFEVTEFGEVFGGFVSVGSANSPDQFEFGSGKHLFGREGSSNDPVDAVRGKLLLNNRDAAVTAELLEGFFPATWNGTMIVSNEFRTRYALAGLSKRGGVNEVNDLPELRLAEILDMGIRPDVQNQVFEFCEIESNAMQYLSVEMDSVNLAKSVRTSSGV